jgi:hypothetical protein
MLSKLEGGGVGPEDGKRNLPRVAEKMNEQEIQEGIAFAKEWEKHIPRFPILTPSMGTEIV